MDNLIRAVTELLGFIEENDIHDEMADDGDGYIDTWRSVEFTNLLAYTQKKLDELKEE